MAKYYDAIGFAEEDQVETSPGNGVWVDVIVEHKLYGDVPRNNRRLNPGITLNDDVSVGVTLSVMADAYAQEHFDNIRYAIWLGKYWTVSTVDATNRPRLILTLGGVYNGQKADPPVDSGDSVGDGP